MSQQLTIPESNAIEPRPASMLEAVMREVANPNVDPARLREFLEIGERLEARQAEKLFNDAMAALQPKLPVIRKNGVISFKAGTKGTAYAKWDDVYKECMPLLAEHGFTTAFSSELQGGSALKVIMTVKHIAGHKDTGSLTVPWLDSGGSKSPAQQAASSFTLAERHVFVKYFNILTEEIDDDGNGGSMEPIGEKQVNIIVKLIEAAKCGESAFLKYMKVDCIADIRVRDYLKATTALQNKLGDVA